MILLHDWKKEEDIWKAFKIEKLKGAIILFASYSYANYSGEAFVLFKKNGVLYEVNASHCSCYDLEDQFDPETTSVKVLCMRLKKGKFGHNTWCENEFAYELITFLKCK